MPDFAPAFRQAGLSVDQQMLGFAPQGDLLFLPQEKEAKELGQKLQLSAELLFVSTTDARTRQESLATGN